MKRICGGWSNVPANLKTKTMLSQIGLKPIREPIAEVWGGHQWVKLYDSSSAVAKRKPTEKQLAALEKARELARTKYEIENTCSECKEVCKPSELEESGGTKICNHCIKRLTWETRYESMIAAGADSFKGWYKEDFVILDTETTDLDGEIVEVGIINRTGRTLFQSLVKPVRPVPDDSPATRIHGITNADLACAPAWVDIWLDVLKIIEGKLILSFNAAFDKLMIKNSCRRTKIAYPEDLKWDCVMEAYRLTQGSERWIGLERASGMWLSHRAIEDCNATLHVIHSQWSDIGVLVDEFV